MQTGGWGLRIGCYCCCSWRCSCCCHIEIPAALLGLVSMLVEPGRCTRRPEIGHRGQVDCKCCLVDERSEYCQLRSTGCERLGNPVGYCMADCIAGCPETAGSHMVCSGYSPDCTVRPDRCIHSLVVVAHPQTAATAAACCLGRCHECCPRCHIHMGSGSGSGLLGRSSNLALTSLRQCGGSKNDKKLSLAYCLA